MYAEVLFRGKLVRDMLFREGYSGGSFSAGDYSEES